MELLLEKDYISIYYDPRHFIVAQWKGYFEPQSFKEGLGFVMQQMVAKKCFYGLNDGRLARGTFLPNIKWLKKEMMPSLIKFGIKKIAYLTSGNLVSLHSLEKLLELTDKYEAQLFIDYDEAVAWLLGERNQITKAPPPYWKQENKNPDKLTIREKEKFRLLAYDDILYLYTHEKGTALHCKNGLHTTKLSLKDVFSQLPPNFIQIHRSYIINIDYVLATKHHKSGSYHVFLKELPGIKIPVSKKNVPILKKHLNL